MVSRSVKQGLRPTILILALQFLAAPHLALAKAVRIEWKPLEKAISYQIQIRHHQKLIIQSNVAFPLWTGDLAPGDYTYLVKGMDRHERFGNETPVNKLRVLAPVIPLVPATTPPPVVSALLKPSSPPIPTQETNVVGYVALSEMLSPYTYRVVSPTHDLQGTTQATAMVTRLSGEYWFSPKWAVSGAVNYADFSLMNENIGQFSTEIMAKYRLQSSSGSNWLVMPKVGLEVRDYPFVIPDSPTELNNISVNHNFVLGSSVGVDVRLKLNDRFSLGGKLGYFLPVRLLSGGKTLDGAPDRRNLNFGVQALYWFTPRWGVGLGGYFEFKSLSYISTNSTTRAQEQLFMDASYFFGSVILRLWH